MTDNGPALATQPNLAEYTVSEIAQAIKRTLETGFEHIRVRGEVSRPNYHGSGHLYFTLKDEGAVLDGVCWRGTVARLGLKLEEGMEIVCTGRISSYPRSSKYQIVVEAVELAGEGALLKLLEDRRKRLLAEGLFDAERKQKLPYLPEVIGVVTSPTGAVIRDILHRLADRFPRRVLVWPVPVQGEGAAEKIAAAIEGFNRLAPGGAVPRPDLLIVARGGGSLEDLWAFNEEVVVRAAAASDIPLISAVGHETDTTLIDFASDLRAPTPTAAAELAVPVRSELAAQLLDDARRVIGALGRLFEERRVRLDGLARGLPDPRRLFETAMQTLDSEADRLRNGLVNLVAGRAARLETLAARLRTPAALIERGESALAEQAGRSARAIDARLNQAETGVAHLGGMLESLSYRNVLERGYVVVRDAAARPVTRAAETRPGEAVTLEFHDESRPARIEGAGAAPRGKRGSGGEGGQGSLL